MAPSPSRPPVGADRCTPSLAAGRATAATALALVVGLVGLLGLGGLAGCGNAPDPGTGMPEGKAVGDFLSDRYLYAERIPAFDGEALSLATAEQALAALRVEPPDRFSYVDRRDAYQAYFDDGIALGLGIGYLVADGSLRLRVVQPHSPAAASGLARGDEVVAIDGVPAASLVAAGTVAEAFGPSVPGLAVRLDMRRGDLRFEVSVAKAWYPVAPVLESRLIEHRGMLVGYLMLATFTEPARAAWAEAVAGLAAGGARALVVDLRDNGGGRLFVAAEVAAATLPAGVAAPILASLRHNERNRHRDIRVPIPASATAGAFEKVVWLTSRRTCSASEVLIAGVMPYRPSVLVGETTCGKPVGFNPLPIGDKVLSAVTFSASNRDGFGDWFDGLMPTCAVQEEPLLPYGDPADPRLAEALVVIATGDCSAAPVAKSAGRRDVPSAAPLERGLASETGLR
jgi:carboxyl-terminal processing protease